MRSSCNEINQRDKTKTKHAHASQIHAPAAFWCCPSSPCADDACGSSATRPRAVSPGGGAAPSAAPASFPLESCTADLDRLLPEAPPPPPPRAVSCVCANSHFIRVSRRIENGLWDLCRGASGAVASQYIDISSLHQANTQRIRTDVAHATTPLARYLLQDKGIRPVYTPTPCQSHTPPPLPRAQFHSTPSLSLSFYQSHRNPQE